MHFYRTCPSISICIHIQHSRCLSDIGSSRSKNCYAQFVHQFLSGSLFLLGRGKGHTKIVWITGISICLFVCLFPPLFLLPTRRCSEEIGFYDYHGMVLNLGGGYSYLGKNGLLEKVFLFPRVAAKFKDLHVCLRLPLKRFCVVHLLCSNW